MRTEATTCQNILKTEVTLNKCSDRWGLTLFAILFSHSQHKLLYNRLKLTRRNLFYFPVLVTVLTWKKLLENAQVVQRLFLRVFILLLLAELIYFLVTYVYKTAIGFGGHVLAAIFNMLLASVTYEKYATRFLAVVKYGFYEYFSP